LSLKGFHAALWLLLPALAGCREGARPPVAETPQRIVALSPTATETLFALGLGERVVGVGDYSDWPPEARTRPRLGGLLNPNLEGIAALSPDLVVLVRSERDLAAKLEPLGIPTLVVASESIADVEAGIRAVARRCGAAGAGERLAAAFRGGLEPRPGKDPPLRVMVSAGREVGRLSAVYVAGPGTFYHELLGRLGAVNVFGDTKALYPQVGPEQILARRPEVILELRAEPLSGAAAEALLSDWRKLPLPEKDRPKVVVLAGDYVMIPGPRLPRLYREMGHALDAARRPPHPLAPSPSHPVRHREKGNCTPGFFAFSLLSRGVLRGGLGEEGRGGEGRAGGSA
jgi:iron complex transport system substrate-binding protein